MDNPARTQEHHARLVTRRTDLAKVAQDLVKGPFVWEVGCGHGHFLTAYAAQHPEQCCIGVDIIRDRIERGVRKRDRAALPNLHFLQAEAREFLAALPPSGKLSAVYVLFPDPWPKRRHFKNRILQPDFLSAVAAKAKPGARLYFRTDHDEYFRTSQAVIRDHADWEIANEPWPFEQETVFQSRAETHHSLIAKLRR